MTTNSFIIKVKENFYKVVEETASFYGGSQITYRKTIRLTKEEEELYCGNASHCNNRTGH